LLLCQSYEGVSSYGTFGDEVDPQHLAIYIWLESSRRALSKIRNPILRFDGKLPKLLAEVWDGSIFDNNSSEQLHLIHASSVELRVPLRSSRRELRPGAFDSSIQPMVRPQSVNLCSALANFIFPNEPPPLLHLGFFRFPVSAGPSSPFALSVVPLPLCFPLARRRSLPRGRRPRPPPPPTPLRARLARPPLRAAALLSPPPPMVERKEKEHEEEDGDFAI
jgi:hypothetical protein